MTDVVAEEISSPGVGTLRRPAGLIPGDAIICQCLKVRHSTLTGAMEAGCRTVRELSDATGAGTECGGCLPRLAELTAESLWQSVRCLEVIDRALRVRSFRFEIPPQHNGCQVQPGQRLIVRGTIDCLDVQRPYTLTTPTTERRYYEITVQREPHGIMSNWLFDHVRPGSVLAILPPSGECFFELAESRPLVCLVGGIGITPALSICRSAAAAGDPRRVHVEYSVSTREQVVCADELSKLASEHAAITCRIRVTREEGRIQCADLAKLSVEVPDCDWLICGSKPFQADVERQLHEHGIAPKRIHIESFRAFSDTAPADLLPPKRTQQRKLTEAGLLVATGVFVVQALADVKWPLLDQLQSKTAYSALTGIILILLIIMQWRLAYARLRFGKPHSTRAYTLHIASGPAVFAMIWLHSTSLGYGLSMAVCLGFLGSLATGAVLSAYPRSPSWESARRVLLASHVVLSCAGTGLAVIHGVTALWY